MGMKNGYKKQWHFEDLSKWFYLRFLFGRISSASWAGVNIFCKSIGFDKEDGVVDALSSYKTFGMQTAIYWKCFERHSTVFIFYLRKMYFGSAFESIFLCVYLWVWVCVCRIGDQTFLCASVKSLNQITHQSIVLGLFSKRFSNFFFWQNTMCFIKMNFDWIQLRLLSGWHCMVLLYSSKYALPIHSTWNSK